MGHGKPGTPPRGGARRCVRGQRSPGIPSAPEHNRDAIGLGNGTAVARSRSLPVILRPPGWDERIARAGQLAESYPFAASVLRFYQTITSFQKEVYASFEAQCSEAGLRAPPEWASLLPEFRELLALVGSVGTGALAKTANNVLRGGWERMRSVLRRHWQGEREPTDELFLARAMLQPYLERVAEHLPHPGQCDLPVCPLCGGKPQAGVLRAEAGGNRSLICGSCSTEWFFRSSTCPACGEAARINIPLFVAGGFEHVRLEVCDRCRRYLKTVDLRRMPEAVPVVDELAAIPLNLWAQEKGYRKIQLNLLGL